MHAIYQPTRMLLSIDNVKIVVALLMALYHLIYTQTILQGPILHQNMHFGFALTIIFLIGLKESSKRWRPLMLAFLLMSLASTIYVHVFFDDLTQRPGFPTDLDVVIGTILIIVGIVATWYVYGKILPTICLVVMSYTFFGSYLPPPFNFQATSFARIISKFDIGLEGMYGNILGSSANFIFLFVLFGSLLQVAGVTRFFTEVGKIAGRLFRGGPAMTAVTSSLLVGSVTGSGVANVVITGSYTIPLMKKVGYSPEQAGAIEAAASTGGQIMPPIMGAAAFVMCGVTGIPYVEIMKAAIIPAILYYGTVALYVQLRAMQLRITFAEVPSPNIKALLLDGIPFLIALNVIIFLLLKKYTPMFSAFWAIVSLISTSFILSFFREKQNRPSLRDWVRSFSDGAISAAKISVVCAVLGPMVASLIITGLAIRIPAVVEIWSGGNLGIALIITALVAIFLGMGVTVVAVYVILGVVVCPLLVNLGVSLLPAHFFAFFFAVFAGVTPPVALAAVVGAGIAGANYFRTAFESSKVALAGFLLPFAIIFCPFVIMQSGDIILGIFGITTLIISILALSIANVGFCLTALNWQKRILFAVSGIMSFISMITRSYIFITVAAILLTGLIGLQLRERRLSKLASEVTNNNG